jgi:hypothetical protein
MRVLLIAPLAAAALLVAACSGGADDGMTLRRGQDITSGKESKTPSDGSKGGSSDSPTPAPPDSTPDPAPSTPSTTDGGATPTTPPAPPATPGSCGDPKCFGFGGFGGCKATNAAGQSVVMGCDETGCACVTGGKTTTTFEAEVASGADAKTLFLGNCDCQ